MTITFPGEAYAFTCTWKTYLLLKRQLKNNTWMKGIFQDTTPILGSFPGYLEKQSHNRMIDSCWASSILPWNTFNATYKGIFSIKSLKPFHIFRHWIADMKKKSSIPLDQVIKKVVTPFNRSGSKRAEPPKFTINTSKVKLWSSHESFFISIHCILLRSPRTSYNHPQCCRSGHGSASIQPGQKTHRRI